MAWRLLSYLGGVPQSSTASAWTASRTAVRRRSPPSHAHQQALRRSAAPLVAPAPSCSCPTLGAAPDPPQPRGTPSGSAALNPGAEGQVASSFQNVRAGPPGWLSGRQNRPDDERDEESEQQDLDATVLGRRRHGGYLPRIRREHRGIGDREGGAKVLGAANTSGHLALKRADCGVTHRAAANPAALRHTNVRRCAKARPAR